MRIDVLYLDGCPNHPPTMELVRDVVRALSIEAFIEEFEVRDAEEAARLRFLGSPTVLVNGKDVDPAVRGRVDFSFSCRMYGRSGLPPRELVEQALLEGTPGRGSLKGAPA